MNDSNSTAYHANHHAQPLFYQQHVSHRRFVRLQMLSCGLLDLTPSQASEGAHVLYTARFRAILKVNSSSDSRL